MNEIFSPIYIARQLQAQEQYYFSPKLLANWLSVPRREAYLWTARLKAAGLAGEVEKGKYLLLGIEPERVLSNSLFIASQLVHPSYISYWSAFHLHGLTQQVPRMVFCATTRKKRPVTFQGQIYRYVTIRPRKFFGYRRERVGELPVLVADEAKAILDGLDQLRYSGGLGEVALALQTALPRLDIDLLVDYANRMRDNSLSSRLGYLLERLGRPVSGLSISSSPIALDPSRPRHGSLDPRWRVVINVAHETELFAPGVG